MKLDDLGIDYIEGGWPGSNPKDKQFFERATDLKLKHAKLTAFGSTRFARNPVDKDPNVRELVQAGTPVISIFGKSWDLHTKRALGITEEENLALIGETVAYLKQHGKEVVYDAEHFFDGYASNPELCAAHFGSCQKERRRRALPVRYQRRHAAVSRSGADSACGGATSAGSSAFMLTTIPTLPWRTRLMAVQAGATHVQGCINGYGERCGNANIVSIIANLELKMGRETVGRERLPELTTVARFISDRANLQMRGDQPFVGKSAFAHKGGVHVSAVMKDASTYEHVQPELIGNRQRVLLSDLSGRSNVSYKLDHYGIGRGSRRRCAPPASREHQGDGAPGLRLRSRRRQLRVAGAAGAVPGQEVLLARRLRRSDEGLRPREVGSRRQHHRQ